MVYVSVIRGPTSMPKLLTYSPRSTGPVIQVTPEQAADAGKAAGPTGAAAVVFWLALIFSPG
jgi:hypothetical protein